jgi:hypothetical protein
MLSRQRVAGGADRVDPIVFRSTGPLDSTDLDDILARFDQASNEPGGEAGRALQRPDPSD